MRSRNEAVAAVLQAWMDLQSKRFVMPAEMTDLAVALDALHTAPGDVSAAEQSTTPPEASCQAKIYPSWANRWVTCGYKIVNGRCTLYGHKADKRRRTDLHAPTSKEN